MVRTDRGKSPVKTEKLTKNWNSLDAVGYRFNKEHRFVSYRLTVLWFHARLDLRMDPEGGAFPHRAQQKSFEVEEDFVFAIAIPRGLMRNDRREVTIPATVFDEHNAARSMGLIRIRANSYLEQFNVAPSAVRTDACAQLQLCADWHRLIDRLRVVGHVARRLAIKSHFILESARRLLHHAGHPGAVRTETINPLKQTCVVASARCSVSCVCCYLKLCIACFYSRAHTKYIFRVNIIKKKLQYYKEVIICIISRMF